MPSEKTAKMPVLRVVEFDDGVAPVPLEYIGAGCHYPVNGEVPFLFCARPKHPSDMYCEAHMRISYNGVPARVKTPNMVRKHLEKFR